MGSNNNASRRGSLTLFFSPSTPPSRLLKRWAELVGPLILLTSRLQRPISDTDAVSVPFISQSSLVLSVVIELSGIEESLGSTASQHSLSPSCWLWVSLFFLHWLRKIPSQNKMSSRSIWLKKFNPKKPFSGWRTHRRLLLARSLLPPCTSQRTSNHRNRRLLQIEPRHARISSLRQSCINIIYLKWIKLKVNF